MKWIFLILKYNCIYKINNIKLFNNLIFNNLYLTNTLKIFNKDKFTVMPVESSLILMHFFKVPLLNFENWIAHSTEADEVFNNLKIENYFKYKLIQKFIFDYFWILTLI